MDKNIKKFVDYGLSNLIVIFSGIIISILIPTSLSVEEFGYWQLFLVYSLFLGVFSFGFIDGIHLRFVGVDLSNYKSLKLFRSFFRVIILLSIFSVSIFVAISITGVLKIENYLLIYLAINSSIFIVNSYFIHSYQITLQLEKYSRTLLTEKILFIIFILIFITFGNEQAETLIQIFTLIRLLILFQNIIFSKNYVFGPAYNIKSVKRDIIKNFKQGSVLLVANLLLLGIMNINKIYVEFYFDIEIFGYFAFAMLFVMLGSQVSNSLSVVIFPLLKKVNDNNYYHLYSLMNKYVSVLSIGFLLSYFFIRLLIINFYESYTYVLEFLHLILPYYIMLARIEIILINFYKILQKERVLLILNAASLIILLLLMQLIPFIGVTIVKFSICYLVFLLIWWTLLHVNLIKDLNNKVNLKILVFDLILITSFIFITHFFDFIYQTILLVPSLIFILVMIVLSIVKLRNNKLSS